MNGPLAVGAGALGAAAIPLTAAAAGTSAITAAGALGAGALGAAAIPAAAAAAGTAANALFWGPAALGTLGAGVGLPIANEIIKQATGEDIAGGLFNAGTDLAGGLINAGEMVADDVDDFINAAIDNIFEE